MGLVDEKKGKREKKRTTHLKITCPLQKGYMCLVAGCVYSTATPVLYAV
jgi:hypothetical protein